MKAASPGFRWRLPCLQPGLSRSFLTAPGLIPTVRSLRFYNPLNFYLLVGKPFSPYIIPMKLQPVVAGSFYPGSVKELQKIFSSFDKEEKIPLPEGETVGMLLPHAGYSYSGAVAALGYRSLSAPVET